MQPVKQLFLFFLIHRLVVGLSIYLLLGTVGRFVVMGARGAEVIPHLDFWKDFPSLVVVSLYHMPFNV